MQSARMPTTPQHRRAGHRVPANGAHAGALSASWPIRPIGRDAPLHGVQSLARPAHQPSPPRLRDVQPAQPGEFQPLVIGQPSHQLVLDPPLLMAPMAGLTSAPLRQLCGDHGAAMATSEMVVASALVQGGRGVFVGLVVTRKQLSRKRPGSTLASR